MTTMLLATIVAMHLNAAPRTVEFRADSARTYHVVATSHCDCYRPQPRIVVPSIEIIDASGNPIATQPPEVRGISVGTANYEITNDIAFTAPAAGTYFVRITAEQAQGTVGIMHERFTRVGFGGNGVLTSGDAVYSTPVVVSQSGPVTLKIE